MSIGTVALVDAYDCDDAPIDVHDALACLRGVLGAAPVALGVGDGGHRHDADRPSRQLWDAGETLRVRNTDRVRLAGYRVVRQLWRRFETLVDGAYARPSRGPERKLKLIVPPAEME